jgi:cytochrome c biogenesis protein CcdA
LTSRRGKAAIDATAWVCSNPPRKLRDGGTCSAWTASTALRTSSSSLLPLRGLGNAVVALTPVFLLSGIASLLSVLSTRLARVADRVDALAEQLEAAGPVDSRRLRLRLAYLRRRSHVLDAAVMMGTLGGVATSCAGLFLFVGTLRDRPGVALFVAFGLALLFTMGALVAFLIEMLLASRGLRDQVNSADEVGEVRTESAPLLDPADASPAPRSVSGPHAE